MKKLLLRLSFFILLFSFISIGGKYLFFPDAPYWGNSMYRSKIIHFREDQGNYQVAIFGSSRLAVGLEPTIFDDYLQKRKNIRLHTFNFSSFGTWNQENYYLFKKFLQDPLLHKNIHYVLMEFQNVMSIGWDRLSTDKVVYYQNYENLKFAWNYFLSSQNKLKSAAYLPPVLLAYLENRLNLGSSDIFFPGKTSNHLYNDEGYTDISKEEARSEEMNPHIFSQSMNNCKQIDSGMFNSIFFERMMELDHLAAEKGICLIWILPPVTATKEMMAVFNALPVQKKINLNEEEKYPVLFDKKKWYDKTHFNPQGAVVFSQIVAREFAKRLP